MPAHARRSRGVRGLVAAGRSAGRDWRRSRPFWGALITMVGAAEIVTVRLSLPVHSPRTVIPAGVLIAAAIAACSLLLLFDPVQRSIYATLIILLAILALTTSHLGGYLVGTVLACAGGATAFAWVPGRAQSADAAMRPLAPGFTLIRGEADDRAGGGGARPGDGPAARAEGPPARAEGAPVRSDGAPVRSDGPPVRSDGAPVRSDGPPVRSDGRVDGRADEADGRPDWADGGWSKAGETGPGDGIWR
jgi:Family of unknown function (DUF6114)